MIKQSYLQSQPSWLSYTETEKTDSDFTFDENGLIFNGSVSEDTAAYPLRTNFNISSLEATTVTFTFINGPYSRHGICFFREGDSPEWSWVDANPTRVAFQLNDSYPTISTTDNTSVIYGGEGEIGLDTDETYTARVVYDPSFGLTATIYLGSGVDGELITEVTSSGVLETGNYRIGIDANSSDEDGGNYITNFIIEYAAAAVTSCPPCEEEAFSCLTPMATSNTCSCRTWKMFYANCPKANRQCSRYSKAYVPAITICTQRLF